MVLYNTDIVQTSETGLIPTIQSENSIQFGGIFCPIVKIENINDDYFPHLICLNRIGENVAYVPAFNIDLKLNNNIKLLNDFKNLNDKWDSKNAKKFDVDFIDRVIKIVSSLTIQPNIFPTSRNSIQLEYEKRNSDYLEIEIFSDDSMNVLTMIGDSEVESKIKNATQIQEQVIAFYVR